MKLNELDGYTLAIEILQANLAAKPELEPVITNLQRIVQYEIDFQKQAQNPNPQKVTRSYPPREPIIPYEFWDEEAKATLKASDSEK